MKFLSLLLIISLSGCSATKLGDLEVLNESEQGRSFGATLRAIDSSCKVLTGKSCGEANANAPQANRTYGQVKQLPHVVKTQQLPQLLSETQDILK